uniref:FBA_3 domain-containing protein n=1 Tax=Syphacia muris TaxID=451379 RepID=A0A0N5AGW8_9BILA
MGIVLISARIRIMQKIGDSLWSTISDPSECHHAVIIDDKIWLISKTYVTEIAENYGHYITYRGGYAVNFDLKTNKWSNKIEFKSFREEIDLEEALFVYDRKIFLFLYSIFGGVFFKHVYQFDENSASWNELKYFQIDGECDEFLEDVAWKSELIEIKQYEPASDFFFLVSNESFVTIVCLSLEDSSLNSSLENPIDDLLNGGPLVAKLNLVYRHREELKLKRPVRAVRIEDKLYWLEGIHGCGFRVIPDVLVTFNIDTRAMTYTKIEGDCPPFSFSGARFTALLSADEWIHAVGDAAVGIAGSKFCGEIWQLVLNRPELKWEKLKTKLPDECDSISLSLVFVEPEEIFYVIDPVFGVSKLDIYIMDIAIQKKPSISVAVARVVVVFELQRDLQFLCLWNGAWNEKMFRIL